ncbi:RagB/SusD family nutrient uptake outer membrane protein [termite gut metagenome]|uniref:RagB/SusD family nutrient uptake outer membrane protein n=1 Tax=termite gut metagenome TaxID=433724 RepID=A0A5J4RPZ4_9ZZZZ
MRIKHLLCIAILGGLVASCNDLNLEPKGILGEPELFGNDYGVKKYFTRLYNYLPIEDFVYYFNTYNDGGFRPSNYWEAGKYSLGNMSGEFVNIWTGVNTDGFGYWPYDRIRDVNTFIANFPNYKDNFPEASYNSILGEAHFLRAFFYFGMAKRMGGVPIVTEVQEPFDDIETLKVPRATEYDTWKFIYEDLKIAIDNMSATSESGRANKYVAAALMSRAMLYAGTIAKYTDYLGFKSDQLAAQQGFAGIDPSKANEFFQYSYDAGKIIENSGLYSLYTSKYPDKAENFAYIFQDATSKENIFIKDYDQTAPNNTRLRHSYDALMSPQPDMSSFVGAESYPSLDLMKMYEFPDITDASGKPIRWNNRSDIRNNMEPRMRGCMYFDGDELRGKTFSIQRGLYKTFPGLSTDAQDGSNDAPINKDNENRILRNKSVTYNYNGQEITVAGAHGTYEGQDGENNSMTGAFVRKYINEAMATADVREYRSGQPWIVFRLGEIYMNQAEACYELDKKTEAFDYIAMIRDRAGCKVLRPADDSSDYSQIYGYPIDGNLKFIRDERYRELAFENHRWWDIRRWRTATVELNDWHPRVLMCYYVLDEGKYIYLDEKERYNRSWNCNRNAY